jgi:putative ABC transport system permease protein
MMLWDSFWIALGSLRGNKMRSFLTMLGIIIGVGSVITMVAIGAGADAGCRTDPLARRQPSDGRTRSRA